MATQTAVSHAIAGHTLTLTLVGSRDEGCLNGKLSIDGSDPLNYGGGYIHSEDSANESNRRNGLQTDTHPEMEWPGAVREGSFEPYDGCEIGSFDEDKVLAAIGVDTDDTGTVDELRSVVRKLSRIAFSA